MLRPKIKNQLSGGIGAFLAKHFSGKIFGLIFSDVLHSIEIHLNTRKIFHTLDSIGISLIIMPHFPLHE